MNKTQLISEVAERTGLTKTQAASAVDAVFSTLTDTLGKGEKVQLIGFGTFAAKFRKEKMSRNPRTNEKTLVPATYRPTFSAGKNLKEIVANFKG